MIPSNYFAWEPNWFTESGITVDLMQWWHDPEDFSKGRWVPVPRNEFLDKTTPPEQTR